MTRYLMYLVFFATMVLFQQNLRASFVTITLNEGVSFQNEGTLTHPNDELKTLNAVWVPTLPPGGTVTNGAYATGSSPEWFDAISANFDLADNVAHPAVDFGDIVSAELHFFIRNGTSGGYNTYQGHHYQVLKGAMNPFNEDLNPSTDPSAAGTSFDIGVGGEWRAVTIPVEWFESNNFDVTLRLYEAQVDVIELRVETMSTSTSAVPEPSSLGLVVTGSLALLIGCTWQRRRKTALSA